MSNPYLEKLHRKIAVMVRAMEDRGLSMPAKVVFVELLWGFHNTADGRCDPAAATIGERIGRTEKSVRTAIAELEAKRVLHSRQRRRDSPEYSFPALDDLYEQDRKFSSGLEGQDRQLFDPRSVEMQPQDRKFSSDKPLKGTTKENLEGTRISQDWRPSQADSVYAINFGLTESQIEAEAENFRDYWLTRADDGALKRDWSAVWRRWVRNTKKYGVSASANRQVDITDWDSRVSQFHATRRWIGAWIASRR